MRIVFSAILLSTMFLSGCKDNPADADLPDTYPSSNVSYNQYIQPIFNVYCNTIGCHDTYTRSGNVSFASYFDATAIPGIIVSKNANASLLVQSIQGKIQPQMPPNRAPLSTNKINAIITWINEGAKNN